MNLGEKIKECRKQAGFSQEQLAERLNVSRQAITKWETNKGIPDIANLIAISDEFGLSLDGFLVATLFMLFFELRIFIREKIYRQRKE